MKILYEYLICYDIKNHKRLNKLARYLDKIALRIEYSVFYLPLSQKAQLVSIVDEILNLIDETEDDVRIYTIKEHGIALGQAINLDKPFIFHEQPYLTFEEKFSQTKI